MHSARRYIESPTRAKVIYLAHAYSSSERRTEALLQPIMAALTNLGLHVGPPRDPSDPVAISRPGWAYRAGQEAFAHIAQSDAFLGVVDGHSPDEGVMVDLGVAIALGKPIFLLRDDARGSPGGDEEYPMSHKLFVGMPQEDWRDYYYTSVEEITAPGKAIARWAHG